MRDAFELVRGGVSEKDLVPVLTHFAFHEGRVYAANGRVQLSAPVPELAHLSLTVPAAAFIAAMDGCTETEPKIGVAKDELSLIVKGKRFRASMPFGGIEEFPMHAVADTLKEDRIDPGLLRALTVLRPLIGEDASRPWCATVLVANGQALATNNIVLAAVKLRTPLPPFALPVFAVDELLRINRDPIACVVDATSVEFVLPGEVHVRAQLLAGAWPDVTAVLDLAHSGAKMTKVDSEQLCSAIKSVIPFCDDAKLPRVKLARDVVTAVGAAMTAEMRGFKGIGRGDMTFHARPLLQALTLAREVGWEGFPRVPFRGPDVRGVVLGLITK